ncbi:MAG TPA: uroporphyrinogen-III synthase [Rhizomicrobium sp.]|jgi:uroporphyrinogen-III synthase|nr:uroporphyrinogen-III synthase [Rhizomicrobium sp.]
MAALDHLRILVPESRELDLFAKMLEDEGAVTLRCPMVQIAELDDTSAAEAWINQLIAAPFDFTVLMTGDGLRKLVDLSGKRRDDFIRALARTRIVTRGPKPARALREIGLVPALTAGAPTSAGVLETLKTQKPDGRRIGVQLYPSDTPLPLVENLRSLGAQVFPVTPYRYVAEADTEQVIHAIDDLAAGRIDLVAFTSSAQIERLFTVARQAGREPQLQDALARIPIAAVGPVMEEALKAKGLSSVVHPASFHLKPLVRAIVAWRA